MMGNRIDPLIAVLLLYMLSIPISSQLVYSNGTVQCGVNIEESIQNDSECDWKLTSSDDADVYDIFPDVLLMSFFDSATECVEKVRQQCPWANIAIIGNAGDCYCAYDAGDSNIQTNGTSFTDDISYFWCSFRDREWNTVNFVYVCQSWPSNYDINRYLEFTVCDRNYNFNYEDISPTLDAYTALTELGLGFQDISILLLLVSMNVLVGLFVIYGLHQLDDDIPTQRISSFLTAVLLLMITSFWLHDPNFSCILTIGTIANPVASTSEHLVAFGSMVVISLQWTYHHENGKKRQCLTSPVWWSVILFCILTLCSMVFLYMFIVPVSLHLLSMSLLPLALCRITDRTVPLSDYKICKSKCSLCLVFILSFVVQAILWIVVSDFSYVFNYCFIVSGIMWFNPLFVISNILLCFTEKWTLVLFHNLMLGLISMFGMVGDTFCWNTYNVQCTVYCLLYPVYIVLLFRSIPSIKPFAVSLIGMTLVEFDLFSDVVVISYFWSTEPIFAALQIAFVAMGQITGAVADLFGQHNDKLSRTDKVMAMLGFGRFWFTINFWKEHQSGNVGKYGLLRQKHKIWELLYETWPSVALQIYAALTTEMRSATLLWSILISVISVSFSVIKFLVDLLTIFVSSNSTGISFKAISPTSVARQYKFKFVILYIFMFSDFYMRTIPMMIFLALIKYKLFHSVDVIFWFTFCTGYFAVFAVFELIANRMTRDPLQREWSLILKVFGGSICSSFHSMLSTLHLLRNDKFYAKSVIFEKYAAAHGVRCVVSMILAIVSGILLADCDGTDCKSKSLMIWMLVIFVVFLALNIVSMYWIYKQEEIAKAFSQIASASPMQSATPMHSVINTQKYMENEIEMGPDPEPQTEMVQHEEQKTGIEMANDEHIEQSEKDIVLDR